MTVAMFIIKRELAGYFATPVAYVFIVVFLFLNGIFTFYLGDFYERGQADLQPFFVWHPWLYLFLVPALGMRLWAEERRSGTIELLMTLPISVTQAVLAKFFAAWAFTAIALSLTFPIWITVNYLGNPDNGVIFAGYLSSLLLAGGYLAISACISALTKNQVIAFVVAVVVCFLFTVSGMPMVINFFSDWAPQALVSTIASFSFMGNFTDMTRGVIDIRHVIYFASLIGVWLFANIIAVEYGKGA